MRCTFIFTLLFFIAFKHSNAVGQTTDITITVMDSVIMKRLPNASVSVKGINGNRFVTDSEGVVRANLSIGNPYHFIVDLPGYQRYESPKRNVSSVLSENDHWVNLKKIPTTMKFTIRVHNLNDIPLEKTKIIIDKPFKNESLTDNRGETHFFVNKGDSINLTISRKGYLEKNIQKVVPDFTNEPYKVYLDSITFIPSSEIRTSFCTRKYSFYPFEGTYFKWKEKPFKTLGRAEFNWWGTTISLGSSLFFLNRQLYFKIKGDKYYKEGQKHPIGSPQYNLNRQMTVKYKEKSENNLKYLLPSTLMFIVIKANFHCMKKKTCKFL